MSLHENYKIQAVHVGKYSSPMEHQQVRLHEHELLYHQEINSSTLKKKDGWKANPASPTTTKKICVHQKLFFKYGIWIIQNWGLLF